MKFREAIQTAKDLPEVIKGVTLIAIMAMCVALSALFVSIATGVRANG